MKKQAEETKEKRRSSSLVREFFSLLWVMLHSFFIALLLLVLIVVLPGAYLAYQYFIDLQADLPRIDTLNDYRPPVVTSVYSHDDRKIAEFYKERRILLPVSQMPKRLIQAFVSAEDGRFFEHPGLDPFSILRAFLKNMEAGEVVQGGSTITQQVARSFFLTPERSYTRKLKEMILAYRIDKSFTKEEILHLYLNQIYLGNGAYGVAAAAESYFGKSVDGLTLSECALLAGLPPAPSAYSPVEHPKMARERRDYVLARMVSQEYITPKEAAGASVDQIMIRPRHNWFLENTPDFTEHVRRIVEERYGADVLYKEGLSIYTTVDIEMQIQARAALEKGLRDLDKRHGDREPLVEGSLLCIEAGTGQVRAMIGGRDFQKSQFNRAVQALRQPGSSFKPLIYAAALDKGFTPISLVDDTPFTYRSSDSTEIWRPENYDRRFIGSIRLRQALAKSRNIPVIRVLKQIGIDYGVDYIRRMGISSPLHRNLSLALGASGVSLFDMVKAYSLFANRGTLVEPVFIRKITDRYGKPIHWMETEPERVIPESTAYLMTSLLESVVQKGTGQRVKALNRPVAGKTGTTNDFRDAWFIGYTPELVTGVWVGFDQERSLGPKETGSRAASPIWLDFMQRATENMPVQEFPPPPGDVVTATLDADSSLLASRWSVHTFTEFFKAGTEPKRYASAPVVEEPADDLKTAPKIITRPEDFFKTGI